MKNLLFFQFFFLFTLFFSWGQTPPVGKWRDHSPFKTLSHVVVLNNVVYGASESGLVSHNLSDNSVSYLTKTDGLSDFGVTCVAKNTQEDLLFVGYANGNIDLFKNGLILNFPQLMMSSAPGNKSIINAFEAGPLLYLVAPFGVLVFDCEKTEIKNTYVFDNQNFGCFSNDVSILDSLLFVATTKGVFYGSLNENLLNSNNWVSLPGFSEKNINSIVSFGGRVFFNSSSPSFNEDSVFVVDNLVVDFFDLGNTYTKRSLSAHNNHFVVSNYFSVRVFDSSFNLVRNKSSLNPSSAVWENDVLWIADKELGLVKNWDGWKTTSFQKNGYASSFVSSIKTKDSLVLVAPGGVDGSWINLFIKDGVWFYKKNWKQISYGDLGSGHDVVSVLPAENGFYSGSWGKGLFFVNNLDSVLFFTENNSSLLSIPGLSSNGVRVGGLCFDSFNNLWVSNSEVSSPLSVFNGTDSWANFSFGSLVGTETPVKEVLVDVFDQIWLQVRYSGIVVLNTGGTPFDPSDDVYKKLSSAPGLGGLPSSSVLCLESDLDGEVWVGTDRGLGVFYSPELVFSNQNFDCSPIVVEQNGVAEELFEDVSISDIVVDGGNRKWVGTSNGGLFLLSEDGTKELLVFLQNNSPLLSNKITAVGIQESSGEVFIGTDKGLVSFRGEASVGSENYSGVYVFPNPVRNNFVGVVTVAGLIRDSVVRFCDISGNVVFETRSSGGMATWDCLLPNGQKAATGVYLVFVSTEEGGSAAAAKFVVVN